MKGDLSQHLISRLTAGTATSAELEGIVDASQSSVARALRNMVDDGRVLRVGRARAARYGYRRVIESIGSQWPLRRVDEAGEIEELGILFSLAADEYYLAVYPGAEARGFAWGGLSNGLPYFLEDQRPGGFLGAAVPARYPELNLPQRVLDWSDDQYLRYLTLHGSDPVSDLILGDPAFDEYLTSLPHRHRLLRDERAIRYPTLAEEAMRGTITGSSTQGEHPKFTVLLNAGSQKHADGSREAIVKFSPSMESAVGRRWGDLLIAEHHAHEVLSHVGVQSCQSEIIEGRDRIFLEVERFDRRGAEGRIGVSSFLAIDNTVIGGSKNWLAAATRLRDLKHIDEAILETVRFVATFGALIANTDRHLGNLACIDLYDGKFKLAPIYDMLPMLFAPSHDEIVVRVFEPPEPAAATMRVWSKAREVAEEYWRRLTNDERISADFREICAACLSTLNAQPRTGAYAYRG
jgi:HipA-like C-terminal domain